MENQTEKWGAYVISAMSVIGFIMQALAERNHYVQYVGIAIVLGTMAAALVQGVRSRTVVRRKTVIRRGKQIIQSAHSKIVLFGGDLSWTDDFLALLGRVSSEGIQIEVIYPLERYDNLTSEAKSHFAQRLDNLREAGASIYNIQLDIGLRCILVDPDTVHLPEHMRLLITNRISKNLDNPQNNKYQALLLAYSDIRQKHLCIAYLAHYRLMQQSRVPVENPAQALERK
jgi:heme exporter protein D